MIVPDLLFYETSNALRYNPHFTANDVKEAVSALAEMGFEVKTTETDIIGHAIEIAFKNDVTVYDACFLALSQIEEVPFVTADYRFMERVQEFDNIMRLSAHPVQN